MEKIKEAPLLVRAFLGTDAQTEMKFDDRDGLDPDEAAVAAVIINGDLISERETRGLGEAQTIRAGLVPKPLLTYRPENGVGDSAESLDASALELIAKAGQWRFTREAELGAAWEEWQAAMVARIYLYRWLNARRRLNIIRKLKKAYRDFNLAARRLGEAPDDLYIEMAKARDGYMGAGREEKRLARRINDWRVEVNHALGLPVQSAIKIEEEAAVPLPRKTPSREALLRFMERTRPDLVALSRAMEMPDPEARGRVLASFPAARIFFFPGSSGRSLAFRIPFFTTRHGHSRPWPARLEDVEEEYRTRVKRDEKGIGILLEELENVAYRLKSVKKALAKSEKRFRRLARNSRNGAGPLLKYHRAKKEFLALKLVRTDLLGRLADVETALQLISGKWGLFGGRP